MNSYGNLFYMIYNAFSLIIKTKYPLKCSYFPHNYPYVVLHQEVVPFSKIMGLVLGAEIVIPEKVRMGRCPLP